MARVAESGSISPKEMAASLEMTTGGITALTDGLVKSGMLTRVNDPSDRRSWIIELTPAAHEVMATIYQEFADSIDVIARKLNPQQQKEIAATLIALGQQLVATQFAT
jgi:DNA-binding MarR family transcriptional regulator